MGGQAVHNLPEAPGPQDTGPGLGRKEDCESPALWGGQSEPPVRGTQRFPLGTPTFRRNTVGRDAGGKGQTVHGAVRQSFSRPELEGPEDRSASTLPGGPGHLPSVEQCRGRKREKPRPQ